MPRPPSSVGRRDAGLSLPPGFISIKDILDETLRPGTVTNVIGIVKDSRLPIPTAGTDYKATMTLYDLSTQEDYDGIEFNIFRKKDDIPSVNASDVLLLYQVKVQRWNSNPMSLVTNYRTVILVYAAAQIPQYPQPATIALQPSAGRKSVKGPSVVEDKYVSWFYREIDKSGVPEQAEFQNMAIQSLNVKQKFSLLKDVSDGKFADLIVQVCREPFDLGDKVTLYVSDYTSNDNFFNYTWEGVRDLDSGGGDVYGYTSKKDSPTSKKWVGPYGKKTIQVTCWGAHADYVRDEVKAGHWVSLRNVQMRFGHDGTSLEGYMREERGLAMHDKVNVVVLETHDRDTIDSRLKDAIRRCRDYTKEKKKEVKMLEASEGRLKRKTDEPDSERKTNSRKRRNQSRTEARKKFEEQEAKLKEEILGLNPLIVCESADRPVTTIDSIIEQQFHQTMIKGVQVKLPLPFICANYCTNVRVVDFYPSRLEDFARRRKVNAFDVLSDNSGDEDSSSSAEEDDGEDHDMDVAGEIIWEWRFALQLEDVTPKSKERKKVWVMVNNAEAQCLTGLDAANLREDHDTLDALREKLFTLWGELEEQKHLQLTKEAETRKRKPGPAPPPPSSDNEASAKAKGRAAPVVSNRPFTCCIRQYGIRLPERDPAPMAAGSRSRWQRVFGLFGTKIGS